MKEQASFHILIIGKNISLANRLLSALRKDKYSPSISGLSKPNTFAHFLLDKKPDLCLFIADDKLLSSTQQIELWLNAYSKAKKAIPLLIAVKNISPLKQQQWFEKGASAVIPQQEFQHLLLAIKQKLDLSREIKFRQQLARHNSTLEKQQLLLLNNSPNAIAIIDEDKHLFCNSKYQALFTCTGEAHIINTSILDFFINSDSEQLKNLINKKVTAQIDLKVDASYRSDYSDLSLTIVPALFKGKNLLQVSALPAKGNNLYSKEKDSLAGQDILTRLENQESFFVSVESAISQAIEAKTVSTLLLVKIEKFETVQEKLGKAGTNQVLYEISEFLHNTITTSFTAARLAENEFGLVLHESDSGQGRSMAEYIHRKLNSSLTRGGNQAIKICASIGMVVINELSLDAEDMINNARMNHLPGPQSGPIPATHSDDNATNPDHAKLIKNALATKNVSLVFQPLVPFQTDAIERYEVRMRLLDENQKTILPDDFLPYANIHNLAGDLDKTVLNQIFEEKDLLPDTAKHFYIHVSGNSLINKRILSWLSKALQQHRVSPERLIFQVNEIDLHSNWLPALQFCRSLTDLGIRLSITHFGSAMEAIPVLSSIKPYSVKLDETLVKDIQYSKQQQLKICKLTRAIHHKEAKVCIAGIEDIELLPLLSKLGIDFIQGFSIQAPTSKLNYIFPKEDTINLCEKF